MLSKSIIENIIKETETSISSSYKHRALGALEGVLMERGFLLPSTKIPEVTFTQIRYNFFGFRMKEPKVVVQPDYANFIIQEAKKMIQE